MDRMKIYENKKMDDAGNKTFYDKIALLLLNNKALLVGLIDEQTKLNIDRQIEASMR